MYSKLYVFIAHFDSEYSASLHKEAFQGCQFCLFIFGRGRLRGVNVIQKPAMETKMQGTFTSKSMDTNAQNTGMIMRLWSDWGGTLLEINYL